MKRRLIIPKTKLDDRLVVFISKYNKDPAWLQKKRSQALRDFKQEFIPYKNEDLNSIQNFSFEGMNFFVESLGNKIDFNGFKKTAGVMLQAESTRIRRWRSPAYTFKSQVFQDIHSVLRHDKVLRELFNSLLSLSGNLFANLNLAFFSGGCAIYAPFGLKINLPFVLLGKTFSRQSCQFRRNLIVADEQSLLCVKDQAESLDWHETNIHCEATEIFVKKNAEVIFELDGKLSLFNYNFVNIAAKVESGGKLTLINRNPFSTVFFLNEKIFLAGEGAKIIIKNSFSASSKQYFKINQTVVRGKDQGESYVKSLVVADDEAKIKCDIQEENENNTSHKNSKILTWGLILSKSAKLDFNSQAGSKFKKSTENITQEISYLSDEQRFFLNRHGFSDGEVKELLIKNLQKKIF